MTTKPEQNPRENRNAYSLLRFSTDRQEWGDSLRRQMERCEQECRHRGWTFDKKLCVTDMGISAFRGRNFDRGTALGKFIEASEKNLLKPNPVLLIENLDRFSRDVLERAEGEFWGLVKRGVDILVLSMGGTPFTKGDQNNVVKKALVMFEFDRAHKESERKSEMINAVFSAKYKQATQGKIVSLGKWVPAWVSFKGEAKQEGQYVPNDHWNTIKGITADFISGQSLNAIVGKLNVAKTPTLFKDSDKWSRTTVRYILSNQNLLGHITVKGKVFKNHIPAVVTETEWKLIEERLRQNGVRRGGVKQGDYVVNLFANRCHCSKCQGSIGAVRQMEKYKYYFCRNSKDGIKCSHKLLDVGKIEKHFFFQFQQETPEALLSKHNVDYQVNLSAIRSRIQTHETNIENYSKAIRGTKNIQSLITALNEEQEALNKANAELEALNGKAFSASQVPATIKSIRETLFSIGKVIDKPFKVGKLIDTPYTIPNQAELISKQLENPETRKKLKELIPSLISHLVIDLDGARYAVVNLAGEQGKWHTV